jgi:chromosome segregation ATPase
MEGWGELELVEVGKGERANVLEDCERVFSVGDLVEFWAGPVVRAYRTDSGDPAFVKEIHGLGWYGIKMVGSFGGRNRRVHWKSLFKDGSFQKQVGSVGGARVRTKARMEERAKVEAEARLGEELRETKRDLRRAQMEKTDMEKEAEVTLRRQENEARKAERDLTVVHKRQLDKMLQENRQGIDMLREDVEEKERETRKCMRQLRQDLNEVTEQVGVEKQGQADLHRQLLGERKKRTRLTEVVDLWKEKYIELDKTDVDKEDKTRYMIKNMNKEMGDKTRAIKTLEKRLERGDVCNVMAVERLENVRNDLEKQLVQRNKDITELKVQSSAVSCVSPLPFTSISSYSPSPFANW